MNLVGTLQLAALVAAAAASEDALGSRVRMVSSRSHHVGGLRAAIPPPTPADVLTPFPTGGPYTYCAAVCCDDTEETCLGADYMPESCASIADGGCPCEEGEEKCDADFANGVPGYCAPTEFCCDETEEHCWDTLTCAPIATGGCPCDDGLTKCGLDVATNSPGWCSKVCCDYELGQEMCYNDAGEPESCADIDSGGCPCPDGQTKCGATDWWPGFCTTVCCDSETEDTCLDADYVATSCAPLATGGCPCPAGEERCGADLASGWIGFCTSVCCLDSQETCYSDEMPFGPESCASIAAGGCPCTIEGETKCGASDGWAGYCTDTCCLDDEETCRDENGVGSCAKIADGGCPCPEGTELCGADDSEALAFARAVKLREPPTKQTDKEEGTAKLVESMGTAKEQAIYRNLQREKKVAAKSDQHAKSIKKREAALVQAIERRAEGLQKGKQFSKQTYGDSFMQAVA